MGTFGADANGEATSGMNHEGESTDAAPRGGTPRSSEEVGESRRSEGGVCSEATSIGPTRKGRSPKDEAKPFCISRWEVWEAYVKVKSNQGAAGLDGQSIEEFERDLKKNLYRIWNRMSSGSYFPPPVRTVKIPKANGGERTLGIPTVSDRIAQMVVKNRLEAACPEDQSQTSGWFNYYGRFTPSALRPIERHVGQSLVRWACRKYKKLRNHRSRAWTWLMGVIDRQPGMLALWEQQRSRFVTIGAV